MTDPLSTDPSPDPQDAPIDLRSRLAALLDEYDEPRGSQDAKLAAFLRASLSARDALELRVARESRTIRGRPRDPGPQARPLTGRGERRPVSITPLYAPDPRPDVTTRLVRDRLARHAGADGVAS